MTVAHTGYNSHVSHTSRSSNSSFREVRQIDVLQSYLFQPIAEEILGFMDSSAAAFFADLSLKISSVSGDARETYFFPFQLVSITVLQLGAVSRKIHFQ